MIGKKIVNYSHQTIIFHWNWKEILRFVQFITWLTQPIQPRFGGDFRRCITSPPTNVNISFWIWTMKISKICEQINQSTKDILDDPLFWIKWLIERGLSRENQILWIEGIQSVKNSEKEQQIILYLKWKLKNVGKFNIPFYTSPVVQDDFKIQIWKICNDIRIRWESSTSGETLTEVFR